MAWYNLHPAIVNLNPNLLPPAFFFCKRDGLAGWKNIECERKKIKPSK